MESYLNISEVLYSIVLPLIYKVIKIKIDFKNCMGTFDFFAKKNIIVLIYKKEALYFDRTKKIST